MHRRKSSRGNGTAAAAGILLVGLGLAVAWLMVAPWVLGTVPPTRAIDATPGAVGQAPQIQPAAVLPGVKIANSQLSQPRDPFRPLLGPQGTTPGTTPGNDDLRVRLVEIRTVAGVQRVTVVVDGQSYDVGIGDNFATNFKLVSIDGDSAVFLFGDNAFELLEGQEVLK